MKRAPTIAGLSGLAAICLTCSSPLVLAAGGTNPTLNDTFVLRAGAASVDGDTTFSRVPKGEPEFDIDLDVFGADGDEISPYVEAVWRFAERWRAQFSFISTSQSGSETLTKELEFGPITIPVGVKASVDFDADIYAAAVGYSFVRSERAELGAGLGLHVADLEGSLSGQGFIGDTTLKTAVQSRADVLAPLPNVSLYGGYAFNDELAVTAGFGWFSLSYDKYDGQLTAGNIALEWRPKPHFGVGLGYTWTSLDLDVDDDEYKESYDFDLQGPMLFIATGF
jgi:hypothetical protein